MCRHFRRAARAVCIDDLKGVERGLQSLDSAQRKLRQLDRRQFAGSESTQHFGGAEMGDDMGILHGGCGV